MPVKSALIDLKDGEALHVHEPYTAFTRTERGAKFLVTIDPYKSHGTFKSVNITTATTTVVTTPTSSGSLVLTDLVVSADKVNNTTLAIQFNDGSQTALIARPDTINDAVNFSWSPAGRIQGWKDAWIEAVTGGAGTPQATVTCGYMQVAEGLDYAEWDDLRG